MDKIRVLIIEDNPADSRLIVAMIQEVSTDRFHFEVTTTLKAGLEKLATLPFEIVLLDLNLPDSVGLDTYSRLQSANPQIPVILMTGLSDESLAIQAVREGVQDYLVKGRVDGNLLTRAMSYAIERKQMEGRLRIADRMVSVGILAAGVAHEINNPLTYVISTLNLIDEELEKLNKTEFAPLRRMLKNAEDGAERVRRIVAELKKFSRVGDAKPSRVVVREILESAIQMVSNQIHQRARLICEYRGSPTVMGHADSLAQVFVNLLVNAVQAIPEGAPGKHEIRVQVFSEGNTAIIDIADSGTGIPPEVQTKIFKPFFTTKPVGEGTGLGLSICYQIVSRIGGEITFRSDPGQGTRFRVTIPQHVAETEQPGKSNVTAVKSQAQYGTGARSIPKARILVIDDEPVIGEVMSQGLSGEHDVEAVTSGAQAFRLLNDGRRFDLIFCDLMMPGMTGPEVYAAIQREFPGLEKRMVFITGGAFTDTAREFLAHVPNPRVEKPFTLRSIRQMLRQWLSSGGEGLEHASRRADVYSRGLL